MKNLSQPKVVDESCLNGGFVRQHRKTTVDNGGLDSEMSLKMELSGFPPMLDSLMLCDCLDHFASLGTNRINSFDPVNRNQITSQ